MDHLEIDGSFGEGGGQILRTSLTFAAITGKPIQIHSVRGKRSKPGFQAQHLAAVHAAQALCDAQVKGDAIGSLFLSFTPTKQVEPGNYRFDIGTAGSACLVLQTVYPALSLLAQGSTVTITGGTHNPKAPSADYLRHVFEPVVSHFGWLLDVELTTPGFYPRGGGRVDARIHPSDPRPFDLSAFPEEHRLTALTLSTIGRDDLFARTRAKIGEKHAGSSAPIQFENQPMEGPSQGISLSLIATSGFHRAGFTGLGERGKSMEQVCNEAYADYSEWVTGPNGLDEHLSDQLAPLAALVPGKHEWKAAKVTDHLRTVLQVIEWFGLAATYLDEETGMVRVTTEA